MTTKAKIWITVVVGLIVIVLVLGGIFGGQIKMMIDAGKAMVPPPEAITTAKAENADWRASRPAVGTLTAVHSVLLAAELPGRVTEVLFDSGQTVHKGQELVRLDTSVEQAQLQSAQADDVLSAQTLKRAKALQEHGSNTPADLEQAEAKESASNAAVAQLRATINKKVIRAPFDGRIGIRQVELGEILAPNTPIATLQSVSPIYAEFWLPQQTLGELKLGMDSSLHTDAFPQAVWNGKITTINPEVDVSTRNVRIRASFPNLDGQLRPGMYGNVEVLSPDRRQVLIIPATSVLYAPYGDSVFTVGAKKAADLKEGEKAGLVAQQKFIRVGERRGDYIAVESGLNAGDTVVSGGVFKLRNGQSVVVKNDLAPDLQIHPNPLER
jgi:membrane fusion protein (multidrug efflux system)